MANEENKLGKVVEGTAKVSSSLSPGKLLKDFIQADITTVGKSMLADVLYPKAKQAIYDAIISGVSMLFWGSGGPKKSGSNLGVGTKLNYAGISSANKTTSNGTSLTSSRVNGSMDPTDIEFETMIDATNVLEAMRERIIAHQRVTVCQFFELAGIPYDNYTMNNFGWDNLDGITARHKGNGAYYIPFPKPKRV